MRLRVVTPVRPVVDADVSEIVAPGTEGEFGVLPLHVTFLGGLAPGVLTYTEGGTRRRLVIGAGYAEVKQDTVTILADEAQLPGEIDAAAARAEVARVSEELSRGGSAEHTAALLAQLALAEARVSVAAG
jgi:F-type H+-transporting ATPase subunit epsilon